MSRTLNPRTLAAEATREAILQAAMKLVRQKGYASMSVDDVCREVGLTKGAFFHHFKSKEEMATATAKYFGDFADQLFSSAPFQSLEDPLDRLLGYLDLRHEILQGEVAEYTCVLGTMVQEVHASHPNLREACEAGIWGHAETLVPMIEAAIAKYPPKEAVDAQELALLTQSVIQGGFILSKATQSPAPTQAGIRHLQRYLRALFGRDPLP